MPANIRDFSLTFVGGDTQQLNVDGDFFRIVDGSGPVMVRFDNGPQVSRQNGDEQICRSPYQSLEIYSAIAQNIKFVAGFDRLTGRQTVNVVASATVEVGNSNNGVAKISVGAGATVQLLAGNPARKWALIQASAANDPSIIPVIGGPGVTIDDGVELAAGVGLPPLESQGSFWCHNPGASSIVVRVVTCDKV